MIILPVISNYSKEKVTIYLNGEYVTTEHAPESFFVGYYNEQWIFRNFNHSSNMVGIFSFHCTLAYQISFGRQSGDHFDRPVMFPSVIPLSCRLIYPVLVMHLTLARIK